MFEELFDRRSPNPSALLRYGFSAVEDGYRFHTAVLNGSFRLTVFFDLNGNVDTTLTDALTDEEYVLYKTKAQGTFLAEVRGAIEMVLLDIGEKCFQASVFRQSQTLRLLDHVTNTYGDSLEFLWERSPDCGIWRRKDTGKWYGVVMTVEKRKLGLPSDTRVEILNLHGRPEDVTALSERHGFYLGWHMNKKHWFTVITDDSVADEMLHRLLAESRRLAVK